jgi:hypothetical protein
MVICRLCLSRISGDVDPWYCELVRIREEALSWAQVGVITLQFNDMYIYTN